VGDVCCRHALLAVGELGGLKQPIGHGIISSIIHNNIIIMIRLTRGMSTWQVSGHSNYPDVKLSTFPVLPFQYCSMEVIDRRNAMVRSQTDHFQHAELADC